MGPVLSVVGMKMEQVVPKSHYLVTCLIHLKLPSRLCPHCLLDTSLLRRSELTWTTSASTNPQFSP